MLTTLALPDGFRDLRLELVMPRFSFILSKAANELLRSSPPGASSLSFFVFGELLLSRSPRFDDDPDRVVPPRFFRSLEILFERELGRWGVGDIGGSSAGADFDFRSILRFSFFLSVFSGIASIGTGFSSSLGRKSSTVRSPSILSIESCILNFLSFLSTFSFLLAM